MILVGAGRSVLMRVLRLTFLEALRASFRACSALIRASEEEMSSEVRKFFSS
jgi:hypothetical protein